MKKVVGIFSLFIFCFVAGYSLLRSTTSQSSLILRDPAAVKNGFDLSHLQGEKLHFAVKQRLLGGLEIVKSSKALGISFGHFVFVDERGEKKLACQEFQNIRITFEADGFSIGGDRPSMEVEAACSFSSDMSIINPIYIPLARIRGESAVDGVLQFNEESAVTVKLNNLPDSWPRTWLLKSVKLINAEKKGSLELGADEVAKYLGYPLVFNL